MSIIDQLLFRPGPYVKNYKKGHVENVEKEVEEILEIYINGFISLIQMYSSTSTL